MNPVQFKVSSVEDTNVSQVKGMTVFNTEQVNTKKQPMFFGQPLGVQRYDSYKYPVFDKLTTQQLGYFWRPEEVSLQKDRGDYHTLRPEQKHIYTSNLKYQIMLDSIQGRGPGMAFIPYCSLPELEACMEVWGFMEMIHSRSYTYIIKNVYSDPSEVFDKIVTDDRILERASSVTAAYDDFLSNAHRYDKEKKQFAKADRRMKFGKFVGKAREARDRLRPGEVKRYDKKLGRYVSNKE